MIHQHERPGYFSHRALLCAPLTGRLNPLPSIIARERQMTAARSPSETGTIFPDVAGPWNPDRNKSQAYMQQTLQHNQRLVANPGPWARGREMGGGAAHQETPFLHAELRILRVGDVLEAMSLHRWFSGLKK